jgi:N,N-dimethylformamidase
VFASGSIAFGQALPAENLDNSVREFATNVVNAFVKDGTLPGEQWISDEKQWK